MALTADISNARFIVAPVQEVPVVVADLHGSAVPASDLDERDLHGPADAQIDELNRRLTRDYERLSRAAEANCRRVFGTSTL
jgi:hypothetical protein